MDEADEGVEVGGLVGRVVEAGDAYRVSARGTARLFVEWDETVLAAYRGGVSVKDLAGVLGESTELVKARLDRAKRLWGDPVARGRFLEPDNRAGGVGVGGFTALGEHRRAGEVDEGG